MITKKLADYILFREAFNLINRKEHRTIEGLRKIISTESSTQWRLISPVKNAFPNIIPAGRSDVTDYIIKDPN
jgi:hypothetical protein